jgi:hypothetical protein
MTASSPGFLERLSIRVVIEGYFEALDRHDREGIERCFTADADVTYLDGQVELLGGRAVADYLRFLRNFEAVQHTISTMRIEVDGASAHVDTMATAVLLDSRRDEPRLIVRGVGYDDWLVSGSDGWRVGRRAHRSLWQYESAPAPLGVPHSS